MLASVVLVDSKQVLVRLKATDTRWLFAFFAVYLLQIVLIGLRWSTISRQLGVPLSWRRASAEYSLSILVNQLLPTGFAGDGLRAVRHARRCPSRGFLKVLEALALDRVSGQLGLFLVVLSSLPLTLEAGLVDPRSVLIALGVAAAALVLAVLILRLVPSYRHLLIPVRSFVGRAGGLLLSPRKAALHLPLSIILIGTLLLQLYFAARAISVPLDGHLLFWLGPLVLLAASVPSFFGGWGIREGASAILFASAGLQASTGVAVSLLFGAFALVCALPGFIVLLLDGQPSARRSSRAEAEASWTHAHAVGMLIGTVMALALDLPPLLTFVGALSLSFLVVQSRGVWTPTGHFGIANAVTTLRLFLTVALLIGCEKQRGEVLAATAIGILLLDLVDGWLARRSGADSPFGARYDMEVDAVFVLSLTFALAARHVAGPWILLGGLWRYLYVLAPLLVPTPVGEAARSIYYRLAYVLMVASFVVALLTPPVWGTFLGLLGTSVISLSFIHSFWRRYMRPEVA